MKRCSSCLSHRHVLRTLVARLKRPILHSKTAHGSRANFRYLTTPDKIDRLHKMRKFQHRTQAHLARLESQLHQVIEEEGVEVDEATHAYLKHIVTETDDHVKSSVPENSFQKIFWEQQKKASALNNSRSMKWHPLMVKWCLYLKHLSSKAYETIRDSGCIALLSQRTLRDYSHVIHATSGFSSEVDSQLIQGARINQIKEWEKCVVLVMDEMYIKEDLVYNKHTGSWSVFRIWVIYEHASATISACTRGGKVTPGRTITKTMLVFMARGFFIRLQFPFAQFPCTTTLSVDQMYDVVWEAIFHLERIGLKVLAVTADGASTNRLFFKLHKPGVLPNEILHKVFNPFSRDGRHLYFSDLPHLIKTVRNAWENKRRPPMGMLTD